VKAAARMAVLILLLAAALTVAPDLARLGSRPPLAQFLKDSSSLAPFLSTPQNVVEEMLRMARVGKDDLVYDLGSGDGRIVITAAKLYGARGVGFEVDEKLVRESQERVRREGVAELVEFRQQDVMTVDLSPATVVTIYLTQSANLKLRPKIASELRRGARVVSHNYHMGEWTADEIRRVRSEGGKRHTLYLWRLDGRRPPAGPAEFGPEGR
jgi:SAM-dependent methyltransferase